ncbi:hypothetical protein AAFF_G00045680 [Aldrovandia affinis]|uniref:Uncharacterized protein n=1 Tax=Aldrovandia affinis TaxID=143900 RepID=A0AAD7WF57_9TELE|nr:hypothetical protein AAFF_G00045680 [Aldrovandia affinis]
MTALHVQVCWLKVAPRHRSQSRRRVVLQEEGDDNPDLPNRRPSSGRQQTQGQGDQPFLKLQQARFDMLQRELGLLRRSINSGLRSMESRAHPLRVSVSRSLERLANAVERQSGPAHPPPTPNAPSHSPAHQLATISHGMTTVPSPCSIAPPLPRPFSGIPLCRERNS